MNASVRKTMDNETAFKVIDLGKKHTVQLYWTSKGGMYGWQVLAVWFTDHMYAGHYKTNGCGYSKENAALDEAFRTIGHMPKGFSEGAGIDWNYKVGGNYYRVPASQVRKYGMKYSTKAAG